MAGRKHQGIVFNERILHCHTLQSTVGEPDPLLPRKWRVFASRWKRWRQQYRRDLWPFSWQGVAYPQNVLVFPSPWEETGWVHTRLSIRCGLAFAYLLQHEGHQAILLPGYLGAGHELEALFLIQEHALLHYPCSVADRGWFLTLVQLFFSVLGDDPWPDAHQASRPLQLRLEGHPNFAHQLLNGYAALASALDALAEREETLQLVGQAAFAPMECLFPEVRWGQPLLSEEPPGTCFELPISQGPHGIDAAL